MTYPPATLGSPNITILGTDACPKRIHRINANSFQQNAITTAGKWQYAALWVARNRGEDDNVLHAMLCRRRVNTRSAEWESFVFDDYEQTTDDGHNTISIAICKGDWTIHLAFDHHCHRLRFRISDPLPDEGNGIAKWDKGLFSATLDHLPGMPSHQESFSEVTYPRFINFKDTTVKTREPSLSGEDLIFTHRIGEPGEGSDVLYRYSSMTHEYQYIGLFLEGVKNNPYINGFDYRLNKFHVSWCYREFKSLTREELKKFNAENPHKGQVGPNGPENNQGLYYACSDDGKMWRDTKGEVVACLGDSTIDQGVKSSITPDIEGVKVFDMPKGSGILNQESQVADWEGGFHVLNRENRSGKETWMHYYRSQTGSWSRRPVNAPSTPTETGSRGSLCVDRRKNLYFVLPGNGVGDSTLSILRASSADGFETMQNVWEGSGYDGEPLVDVQRLEEEDVISVFTRTDKGEDGLRKVVVLDFDVGESTV